MPFSDRIKEYLGKQFDLPEDQVELMLPEFKKTLSSHFNHLERVNSQDNLEDLQKAAHTIKGAFLNLGLADCAELALKIEGAAAKRDTSRDYSALINDIGDIVHSIVNE